MEISSDILKRFSPRIFSDQPISDEIIETLIEAARWAASSRNSQPWRFIIGKKGDGMNWENIFQCLTNFNQQWAVNAPILIMVLTEKIDPVQQSIRRHAFYDVGLAIGNLTSQAMSLGIYLRNMGGFEIESAVRRFSIPTQFEPVVCLALGYPGNIFEISNPNFVEMGENRSRRELPQLIFNGSWDNML